jgi:hypothetical protein
MGLLDPLTLKQQRTRLWTRIRVYCQRTAHSRHSVVVARGRPMGVWAHNRKVDADARAHRCRQQKVDTGCGHCRNNLCQIQRLRQNSVPIGTVLMPQPLHDGARSDSVAAASRFDAPDSAHYAYRRTLTCGPRGCGSASHHTIGSTVHLSVGSRRALVCAGRAAGLFFSPMNALAVLVERDYPKSSKNNFRPRGT